ncbi:Neutral and basic amino acid transport protein rBAT [Holothuria leucospilota]|uniref:Neutral and basic amino acid transport protein rBAT n=1 Tax=Holothuria leucospilota TaxID=206669 RepID=A0A9Q1C4H0_HOLLE|nr:Neutral and basic amino acid transport protein rBAT [Holothuria leucospilota]
MNYWWALITAILLTNGCSSKEFTWREWWKNTIIYQIYPRSFQDSDGDGVGDLKGITSRLHHLKDINVGCIWISPIFKSPMADFGYDVSDFNQIDPLFGTNEDLEELLATAKSLGLKVLLDFVPNHSSNQHRWFIESSKNRDYKNEFRDYYTWADPKAGCQSDNASECLPNNWVSVFGGSVWEWNENRKQFYLHQFLKEQPDFNLHNPMVQDQLRNALSFWMEKGIDGYRVDAIAFSFEAPSLEDEPVNLEYEKPPGQEQYGSLIHTKTTGLFEVHTMLREWRRLVFEEHSIEPNYKFMVVEVWEPPEETAKYYGTDEEYEADMPFNFQLITGLKSDNLSGRRVYELVDHVFQHLPEGKWPNWVVGNHDQKRIASRLGDKFVRASNTLNILLPGTATTYYGEEIGMQDVWVSYEESQDPWAVNNPCCWKEYTRDPARSPMQWDSTEMAGFSSSTKSWLPIGNSTFQGVNVQDQSKDPKSTLNHYKSLANLRITTSAFQTNHLIYALVSDAIFAFFRFPDECDAGDPVYLVAINFDDEAVECDFVTSAREYNVTLGTTGLVTLSTGMDRNGNTVKLDSLSLASGEALVIQVEILDAPSFSDRFISFLTFCVVLFITTHLYRRIF